MLRTLTGDRFECFAELWAKVDTKARICVRQSFYSVPARLARRRVVVRLHAHHLEALVDGRVVPPMPGACTRALRTWCWTTTSRS